uniref:Uncharacterized protein n=2 Tax=Schizaphis graminum TaxID=13262 RepID=A0A2S2NNI8_SCHGA
MLQVELWLGSWELPNVPFVNHVAPYVKASYMNYWCNNIKREEIDRIPNVPNYFGSLIERLWGAGLQKQLTKDHPLISLYRNVYWMTHPYQPKAIKRYLATASRVLRYVQDKCIQNEIPVHHWLVLLQQPDYIIEYLRLREKLGQATRTTINYLQVLKPLLFHAMTSFPYDDPTFPIVDGVPDHKVIDGFKYTLDQLLKAFPEIKKK